MTALRSRLRACRSFLADVLSFRPRLLSAMLGLTLANAVLEALTFTSLVPLLVGIGLVPGPEGSGIAGLLRGISALWGSTPTLGDALGVFMLLLSLRAFLAYAAAVCSARYVNSYVDCVRSHVYSTFARANWQFIARSSESRSMHAVMHLAEGQGYAVMFLIMFINAAVLAAIGFAVAVMLAPLLAVSAVLAGTMLSIPLALRQVVAYRRARAALESMQQLSDVLMSRLTALKLAKAFSVEAELEEEFHRSSRLQAEATWRVRQDHAQAKLFLDLAAALTISVFVYAGVRVFSVSNAELVLLIAICARILPLMSTLQLTIKSLIGLLPQYESLYEQLTAARLAAEPKSVYEPAFVLREALELRGVTYAYPNASQSALRGISLVIPARRVTAIIGGSGAGKSTLADIIAGLAPATSGDLLVDGRRVGDTDRVAWRRAIAYVPQDAPLFNDTIRANLVLSRKDVTDEEVSACLDIVNAGFVRGLPQGLESIVGDRGVRLSGGQRQRLRLASALLRKPQVLILDEATSALSPEDERPIIDALRRFAKDMTVIVIAHRASSVHWADFAVRMKDGDLVATGTPSSVLQDAGYSIDYSDEKINNS